jgi:hypothetical protein
VRALTDSVIEGDRSPSPAAKRGPWPKRIRVG